ncbi:MAG: Glycosyl transferase family 2 [Candidatus Gottesmanbacteria bacterium GW2011_GWB1_43_11]|uniref:Glycosyl transferase family 2 n=1 Tax=Candidatus Gottesmanbacteria bacterium GW2011_GWB1_43_11 TaxID=1618446 RepID=A0A0G1CNW5_9BACT|nr:MAG: Glycosyl transferase family 2 [Candidatus Gottesmanbacteria bacterium GW2011_GWA2_42_16]KKS56123.1 MAG: Glycosyl transferase family 2 [Candidatus Gottesmanbacteria bacterium GW2011_GWA1_42_26]KKS82444.1 MAG: Glycosyl transferase family 2 [Candidatus Gottesmanbacteria bacterium GW2011_GWC1_43_10]KKS87167.1 MAG: Glycosyl transferase family 2 [Candidatus Gottesmanbacteria bacterium GW2011_GWB1_43_11]OGG08511.1 MAG: hypothetical protein A2699_05465 [Candidatus Gottesmanbacteria bacterium RI
MKKPLISVLLPIYNEEKHIRQCLDSLLIQTYKPVEILIADDGSTDATVKMVKTFPVKLFINSHRGPAVQTNFLASKARGKILIRADGDMVHDRNYLTKLVEPILKGETFATFNNEAYLANPQNTWAVCWSLNRGIADNLIVPKGASSHSWVFRAIVKQKFMQVGGYDDVGYEDDQTVLTKLGMPAAINAPGAISYCYNPESGLDVFNSSRWIGRGVWYRDHFLFGLLKHNLVFSLIMGIYHGLRTRKITFIPFRLLYDAGISLGLVERKLRGRHIK